jgi:glycosyltransferase involved in cell wall biosynthesis
MRLVFISTMMGAPWGGSEELWSQAAVRMAAAGHPVAAFTEQPPPYSPKFASLAAHDIELQARTAPKWGLIQSLWNQLSGRPPRPVDKEWLLAQKADLVVISQGGTTDGQDWMEFCRAQKIPYATIVQCNSEIAWVQDGVAAQLAADYRGARAVYCVSQHNLRLLEWQIGEKLPDAKAIWNPNNVSASDLLTWPEERGIFRLASVARLEPSAKGQDMLFQVLAQPVWRTRPVELNLFGTGRYEKSLRKMMERLQLANVHFRGHVADIAEVWRDHHLLVMPSRQEGLPLALIEAMSCGRPAVVTDVGGNAELCVDGETGFVASAAAMGPFGDALERAWAHREEWPAMGQAAHLRVRQIVPADPVGDLCGLITDCVNPR